MIEMAFLKDIADRALNMTCSNATPKNINDAILNPKNDSSLFYTNAACASAVSNTAFNIFTDYGSSIITSVIFILFAYLIYKTYWNPIRYVKELTEVGFEHIAPGPDRVGRIARAQASRRMGTKIPPPYPNGWFAVAESRDLKIGDVISVDALGQNLCVYRGADGGARCVDAYCPHLGANLGVGGTVCGNCIECPFHKWRFNEEGSCVSVPGVDVPKGVAIKTWTCVEADGAVWIWHDAEARAPLWGLTDAPECAQWGYRGRNEFIVNAHIQEIPENGADVAHLNAVHSASLVSALGDMYPFLTNFIGRHIWNATWTRNDDHTANMTLSHDYKMFKYNIFHVDLQITQTGPGHVRLYLQTPIGPYMFSQSVTPIGPLLQKVVHRLYSPIYNAPASSLMIIVEAKMIERDIRIWNSKKFVSAPTYVKTDKTIRAFRAWYSQFYTDHSISYRDSLHNPLDW